MAKLDLQSAVKGQEPAPAQELAESPLAEAIFAQAVAKLIDRQGPLTPVRPEWLAHMAQVAKDAAGIFSK